MRRASRLAITIGWVLAIGWRGATVGAQAPLHDLPPIVPLEQRMNWSPFRYPHDDAAAGDFYIRSLDHAAAADGLTEHGATQTEELPPYAPRRGGSRALSPSLLAPPSNAEAEFFVYPPAGESYLDGEPLLIDESPPPSDKPKGKPGMLQYAMARYSWLPALGDNGFGSNEVATQTILAVPLFVNGTPLLLSPAFNVYFFDGPQTPDVPSRVHEALLEFRWMNMLTERLGVDLAVAPGIYSDFDNTTSDSLRITGRGIGMWEWSPQWQFVLGVVYLDRIDVRMLPVFGAIWKPTEDHRYELIFPRPRLSRRVAYDGFRIEHWIYLAGEFGGNSWAYQRDDGTNDILTYRDLRAALGWERKALGGLASRVEIGYVFGREIEFQGPTPSFQPNDTLYVRTEVSY